MTFDDVKEFEGRKYSGMPVGASHAWRYPHGEWREQKVAPDRWRFTFKSSKRRARPAPVGSGAGEGTQYHWYLLAHQRVRKVDKDSYTTLMEGVKHKVAHKRPHWRRWSSEYPDQVGEREKLIGILENAAGELRAQAPPGERSRQTRLDALDLGT